MRPVECRSSCCLLLRARTLGRARARPNRRTREYTTPETRDFGWTERDPHPTLLRLEVQLQQQAPSVCLSVFRTITRKILTLGSPNFLHAMTSLRNSGVDLVSSPFHKVGG